MTQEAEKDGSIDEDEQAAIDAMYNAIQAMRNASSDGKITNDEVVQIEALKTEASLLAHKAGLNAAEADAALS